MTVEFQPEVKKSDERWHASYVTKLITASAALSVVSAFTLPDPESKRTFAGFALIFGTSGGAFLAADAIVGSVRNKLKKVTGKQKSS